MYLYTRSLLPHIRSLLTQPIELRRECHFKERRSGMPHTRSLLPHIRSLLTLCMPRHFKARRSGMPIIVCLLCPYTRSLLPHNRSLLTLLRASATRAPRSGTRAPSSISTGSSASVGGDSPRSPGGGLGGGAPAAGGGAPATDFPYPAQSVPASRGGVAGGGVGGGGGGATAAWPPLAPLSGGRGGNHVPPPNSGDSIGKAGVGTGNTGSGAGQGASTPTLFVGAGVAGVSPAVWAAREATGSSYDPERSSMSDRSGSDSASALAHLKQGSFASNQSFDPESYQRSSTTMSDRSFDPERLSYPTAVSSQASYDPERDLVTAQTSYDPERSSLTSNTSYDPERQSVYAKSNNPEKSFDPEGLGQQYSFASQASFDPEHSVWGASSSSANTPFKAAGTEPSIDPEASMMEFPSPRGGDVSSVSSDFKRSGKHLDHITAMLRRAIKGEATEQLTQQPIDGDEVEGSRVCSTVMSFDPERGHSGASSSSREKSFASEKSFDPEASQVMSAKMSEKSFDPEASSLGLLAGPSYDPSADFTPCHAASSELSADEFDPERLSRQPSISGEKSFDPETQANAALVRSAMPIRAQRAPPPAAGTAEEFVQLANSPPGGQGRAGASICALLSEEGGRFLMRRIWDDAQLVARIGDEVVKINGLDLHGMTIEEVVDVLEGPPGTLVDMDLRTTMGAPRSITLSRKYSSPAKRDSASSGGALGELSRVSMPNMYSPPSGAGFPPDDQAAMIQQFEGQYITLRREAAEKDRIIEELRARLATVTPVAHGNVTALDSSGGEEAANVRAVLMSETKKALAAKDQEIKTKDQEIKAKDLEVERLRGQVQQAAEFNDRMSEADEAKDTELRAANSAVAEQMEVARAARVARDRAEAQVKALMSESDQLKHVVEQLKQELQTLKTFNRDKAHAAALQVHDNSAALARARGEGAAEQMVVVEEGISELLDAGDRRAVFERLEASTNTEFCELLARVLEKEHSRGVAAGRDAEQRAQLALVQHQASQSRRSRGRRGRSRGLGSEKSYGASNEVSLEDFDSDEDGMVCVCVCVCGRVCVCVCVVCMYIRIYIHTYIHT
jgi:hypothetical protein